MKKLVFLLSIITVILFSNCTDINIDEELNNNKENSVLKIELDRELNQEFKKEYDKDEEPDRG